MSWRDQYQQGSFRGVPFRTVNAEGRGGRRVELHEFAGRDDAYPEDLGGKASDTRLTCWLAGDDYMTQCELFEAALNQAGPGTLVHPFRGIMKIQIMDWTVLEDAGGGGGGIADYSIEFVKYSPLVAAPAAADTRAQAKDAADKAQADAPAIFAKKYKPGFGSKLVTGFAQVVQAAGKIKAFAAEVRSKVYAFEAKVRSVIGQVNALIRLPGELAREVVDMVRSIGDLGSSIGQIGALFGLAEHGGDLPAVLGDTEERRNERASQAALQQLFSLAASAEVVRAIADTDFASYQDAVAMRDRAADLLDRLMVRSADAGDDDGAQAFADLRLAMIRDVTARGGSLARLQSLTPRHAEPALVIAYRTYGGNVEARAAEIVSRNRIAHPGFVPGGRALQILTPAAIDGAAIDG